MVLAGPSSGRGHRRQRGFFCISLDEYTHHPTKPPLGVNQNLKSRKIYDFFLDPGPPGYIFAAMGVAMELQVPELEQMTLWKNPRDLVRSQHGDSVRWQVHLEREVLRILAKNPKAALAIREDSEGNVALFTEPVPVQPNRGYLGGYNSLGVGSHGFKRLNLDPEDEDPEARLRVHRNPMNYSRRGRRQ